MNCKFEICRKNVEAELYNNYRASLFGVSRRWIGMLTTLHKFMAWAEVNSLFSTVRGCFGLKIHKHSHVYTRTLSLSLSLSLSLALLSFSFSRVSLKSTFLSLTELRRNVFLSFSENLLTSPPPSSLDHLNYPSKGEKENLFLNKT